MPKVFITEQHLEDIGAALRRKGKTDRRYYPSEMAEAVDAIISAELGHKTILDDGTYSARKEGFDGFDVVTVKAMPPLTVGLTGRYEGRKGTAGFHVQENKAAQGIAGDQRYIFLGRTGCSKRTGSAVSVCCGNAQMAVFFLSGGLGDAQAASRLPRGGRGIIGTGEEEGNVQ